MILKPDGSPTTAQREQQYDPRLVGALGMLEKFLRDNGLGLFCMRCHRLGLKDGVQGNSGPDEYVLQCGCTRRTLSRSGLAKVMN